MALNRLNDYLFKWTFGRVEHKSMLLDLVNAVLTNGSDENIIVDFDFKDRELDPRKFKEKESLLDILGKTSDGTIIDIEVQIENKYDIDHRALYYWAKNYSMQLIAGDDYKDLKKTICICIMNFDYFDRDRYHSCYNIQETIDHKPLNNDMEIHFIELRKWALLKRKPANRLEKWLLYLADNDPRELENVVEENSYIARALASENTFCLNDGERYLYDMREKFLMDQGATYNRLNKLKKLENNLKDAEDKLNVTEEKLNVTEDKLNVAKEKLNVAEEKLNVAEEKVNLEKARADSAEAELAKLKQILKDKGLDF